MAPNLLLLVSLAVLLSLELLVSPVFALTNPLDATALQGLYKSLNYPPQLKGWKSSGGDPCGVESWTGISCFGSSVKFIKLHGLDLKGDFGHQLYNLYNLRELDLSSNHLYGEIPSLLPPYITHIDLSCNNFSQSIPYSLATMKNLHYLNLSHNSLSGPIGNIFTDLKYLKEMDLSYNSLTGDLPSSFANLTNLTGLSLQNNKFTGSVTFLSNLPLTSLNIQNNHFSGVIPWQFQSLRNLWFGGNAFDPVAYYPPWGFPSDIVPTQHNTSSPQETPTNVVGYHPLNIRGHKHKRFGPGGIACIVVGVALVAICVAVVAAIRINKFLVHKLESMESNDTSPENSASIDFDYSIEHGNIKISPTGSPFMPMPTPPRVLVFPTATENTNKRISFSRTRRTPLTAKMFTVADLQSATNSFSEDNLLGEGSLGSVYRGEFTNGQVLAVKIINMPVLTLLEEDQFLEVIWNVARLRHPNIVTLVGYSVEHGQHLLAYEYVGNTSLDHALHGYEGKHISWSVRIRIALGVARALLYLHSTCLPPVAHCNLKAANILLDDELTPYLSDCGLAVLWPLTSNRVKLKASELAISCKGYYAPPESSQPGMDKVKGDVYAFGVLLLELLTARRPFDRSRPKEERSLVKWASSHLHVYDSLEAMVDTTIKRTFSSRSLSWFADIVSLCIQPEPEFRPTMSEIVESLVRLNDRNSSADGAETNSFELSFQTVDTTEFIGSPATSYASI